MKAFQKKYKLSPVDGEIGPFTKDAIDKAFAAKESTSTNPAYHSDTQQVVYGTPIPNAQDAFCAIGDIVNFIGSQYFKTADGAARSSCKPGKALVIGLSKNGKYPYQLCKINGYGSTVYGWVAFENVSKVS